jgi:hypothetical protein
MTKKLSAIFLTLLFCAAQVLADPVYNALPPIALDSGVVVTVWSAETPTPGNGTISASQQVALQIKNTKAGSPFSVDGKFSGAPGTFEVDLQIAASDVDTNYQTCISGTCQVTTVDAVNNTFHIDAILVTGKFARLLMRSRANSVTVTATFTGG